MGLYKEALENLVSVIVNGVIEVELLVLLLMCFS